MSSTIHSQVIGGLGDIIDSYDALFVDLWGVTHNGRNLFPQAVNALELARSNGLKILFLSNAPRRQERVKHQLKNFGLSQTLYDAVITSGDAAWHWIQSGEAQKKLGRRCFHLGDQAKDKEIRQGLNVEFVDDPEQATFVLNTGPPSQTATLDEFESLLKTLADCRLPMVCANPDLSVVRGNAEELCAGAIATEYEKRRGEVVWFGKPWPQIYQRCQAALSDPSAKRILCIGDSMRTDIRGANKSGLDSLLVATGLHRDDLLTADKQSIQVSGLKGLCAGYNTYPTYVCVALKP